jgi:hypothetical protein
MAAARKSSSPIDPNGRARTGRLLNLLVWQAGTRSHAPAGSPAMESRTLVGTDHVAHDWPQHVARWLRRLGGKLGPASDLDGPYILLADISAVYLVAATLAFAVQYPFSRAGGIRW